MKNNKSFYEKVWELTKKIPKGKVTTYKIIAEKLGTKAYRAVGTALAKNPYGAWGRVGGKFFRKKKCLVPCHRVINSDGNIGNYSGKGGRKGKVEMLKREGVEIKNNKVEKFNFWL